jgi:small subunit ribosomal protein S2
MPAKETEKNEKAPAKADKPTKEETEAKKAKLLELAKKLEGKVDEEAEKVDLKSKLKKPKDDDTVVEKKDTLVPMDDYLKASIHLGTRVITPDMKKYVYRRRPDGLAVFNTATLDDELRESIEVLNKHKPEEIVVICKREAGWPAVKAFAEATGVRSYTKKYPAGILTNAELEDFIETGLLLIGDPWIDKNALADAKKMGLPVLAICDTNNYTAGIKHVLPGNNKSHKSLGMMFFLLAKHYHEKHKLQTPEPQLNDFVDGWENLAAPTQ